MMNQQTLDKLHALRWYGLAEAWSQADGEPGGRRLSFDERFRLLVDQHWTWRENQAMARRLKKSKLDTEPCVEDIDFRHPRGLGSFSDAQPDQLAMGGAASLDPVYRPDRDRQVVAGTGSGAEGVPGRIHRVVPARCRNYSATCPGRVPTAAWARVLETIARTDVLVVDDFAMAPLNDAGAPRLSGDLR